MMPFLAQPANRLALRWVTGGWPTLAACCNQPPVGSGGRIPLRGSQRVPSKTSSSTLRSAVRCVTTRLAVQNAARIEYASDALRLPPSLAACGRQPASPPGSTPTANLEPQLTPPTTSAVVSFIPVARPEEQTGIASPACKSVGHPPGPQWQRGSFPTPGGNTHQTYQICVTCH